MCLLSCAVSASRTDFINQNTEANFYLLSGECGISFDLELDLDRDCQCHVTYFEFGTPSYLWTGERRQLGSWFTDLIHRLYISSSNQKINFAKGSTQRHCLWDTWHLQASPENASFCHVITFTFFHLRSPDLFYIFICKCSWSHFCSATL